jgi:hypothetical protein
MRSITAAHEQGGLWGRTGAQGTGTREGSLGGGAKGVEALKAAAGVGCDNGGDEPLGPVLQIMTLVGTTRVLSSVGGGGALFEGVEVADSVGGKASEQADQEENHSVAFGAKCVIVRATVLGDAPCPELRVPSTVVRRAARTHTGDHADQAFLGVAKCVCVTTVGGFILRRRTRRHEVAIGLELDAKVATTATHECLAEVNDASTVEGLGGFRLLFVPKDHGMGGRSLGGVVEGAEASIVRG